MFPQQPQTIITLRAGDPSDMKLYVIEDHDIVIEALRTAKRQCSPIVTFRRVLGDKVVQFSTQPTNVLNVEAYA